MAEEEKEKTPAQIAAELQALTDKKKLAEEIKKLTEDQLRALKDLGGVQEKINVAAEVELNNRQKSVKHLEKAVTTTKAYLEQVNKLGNGLEENNLKLQAAQDYHRAEIALRIKAIKEGDKNVQQLHAEIKAHEKIQTNLQRQADAMSTLKANLDKVNPMTSKLVQSWRVMEQALAAGPKETFMLFASMAKGPALKQLKKGFNLLRKSITDVFFAVDNVTHAFQRQTGMGDKYNAGMKQSYLETRRFGATMEDVSKQTQTLIGTVSDFSLESAQAGTRVAQTGVLLEKLGVQGEDFAKGIQNSMKMFGQSMMQGEQTARELLETSKALGIEPKKLAGDYAKMGGQLAKLGRDGPQAFKELARVSKITGMEMEKVLSITNKFDTFESAAEMTGKLNAALGGNFVNAMDMMMDTDPVSRFEKMRDAISQTGLTFDDMSYYQRKFYAESMGLSDVGDLALMMSGNMDMMSGATQKSAADYEKLAEEAKATMSLQEKFNSFLAQVAPILEDLMVEAHIWMDWLQNNKPLINSVSGAIKFMAGILVTVAKNWEIALIVMAGVPLIFAGVSFAIKGLTLATNRQIAASLKKIATAPQEIVANEGVGNSALRSGQKMQMGSKGAGAFALKMLAVGAAIGMITGGIGYMANGLANLFNAISGEKIAIFTAFMSQIGQGGVLATAGLAPLAALFGEIAVELDKVDGNKLDKLTNIGKGFEASGGEALSTMLTQIAGAMAEIPEAKAEALTATMSAANLAAKSAEILIGRIDEKKSSTAPSPASGASAGSLPGGGLLGTIKLDFNTDLFDNKVVKLSRDTTGKLVVEAIQSAE